MTVPQQFVILNLESDKNWEQDQQEWDTKLFERFYKYFQ